MDLGAMLGSAGTYPELHSLQGHNHWFIQGSHLPHENSQDIIKQSRACGQEAPCAGIRFPASAHTESF